MPTTRAASRTLGLVAMLLATAGCPGKKSDLPGERQACREPAGDAGVCAPGLTCMSGLCVRPPPADCGAVADTLVSLELGNYASREERAARLPAKRALCEEQRISADEATCLAKAADTWSAGSCVPRLFPRAEGAECDAVIARLRGAILGAAGSDPAAAAMIEKAVKVMTQSCAEDGWPEALRHCILDSPAGLEGMSVCEKAMPAALKDKLQQRMRALSM